MFLLLLYYTRMQLVVREVIAAPPYAHGVTGLCHLCSWLGMERMRSSVTTGSLETAGTTVRDMFISFSIPEHCLVHT